MSDAQEGREPDPDEEMNRSGDGPFIAPTGQQEGQFGRLPDRLSGED